MPTQYTDIDGARTYTVDGTAREGSIFFIVHGSDLVVELDKMTFLSVLKDELGLEMIVSINDMISVPSVRPDRDRLGNDALLA